MANQSGRSSYDHLMKLCAALTVSLMCAASGPSGASGGAAPQSRPTTPERSPAAVMAEALRVLSDEGKQSLQNRQLARPAANFAQEFGQQIPTPLVNQKIIHQLNSDPFIDAYVRWQLTSFKGVALAADMTERQFQKFLDEIPGLIENPRADRELIDAIIAKTKLGPLNEPQQKDINTQLNGLSERTSQASGLNQAPLRFRGWVREQLPEKGMRVVLADLELCAATVQAGWPSDECKAKLESTLKDAVRDRSFTADQRQIVLDRMRQLIGKKNLYISSATLRDGAIAVEYGDTGIYDFDVRKWARIVLQQ